MHAIVWWKDFDGPGSPDGWHLRYPRGASPGDRPERYLLNPMERVAMEKTLWETERLTENVFLALRNRVGPENLPGY